MRIIDLRKQEVATPVLHPFYEGEMNDGSTMTEQTYIPLKDQIEAMLLAGRQLEAYRKELYDFSPEEDVDEGFDDPTRYQGWDAADAAVERARLLGKRDRLLKAAAVKAAEEAKQLKLDLELPEQARNDTAVPPKTPPSPRAVP